MNRRDFLITTSAATLFPRIAVASTPIKLIAQPVNAQILPEGEPATPMLGFNGGTPGPVLRASRGDTFDIRFQNRIGEGSAVHWHGLRIDNAMDGVPGMTQDVVEAGGEFEYRFRAPDAGTFWYHSHNRSWEQVAKGLYGPLIVDEQTPPDVDHDLIVMIDDWRLTESGALAGDFENMHDQAHQGRLGNFARALVEPNTPVRRGDRVRLRLINVATDRIFPVEFEGIDGKVVALDGMPLVNPQELSGLILAPAQRADIITDVASATPVSIVFPTRDGPYLLGEIPVEGTNTARQPGDILVLPPNEVAQPDMDNAISLTLTMEGGAMSRRMMQGMMGGDIWAFNGQSGLTDTPLHSFERGQTARIRLVNDTRFPHGIHLHGHHFFEVGADDNLGALRDTTLVDAGETRDIVCVFDNPGRWLIHCHMLGHQAAGMKTWVEVA
ncbi:multicopper oxidase domain-containing protein [Roseobacter sp. HKCCD9010]|uniref:multicopper oxidase family protein n=1 Tax=unclassified Roseobacter TaxID=196798 RepID=UPI001490CA72|nr:MULTISPECIES: multicopper oxidase family protein [unclassified Roseobacter]MBF9049805.1 multicopper oxidase domain-containing protein [Rhodobacterales bacterium HKCCD4356]NNV13656.1 multicopper oxidase domain-containing protein [Roseobacter sp. HKCCD7357]NNV16490.1 multicopper oxidase domain-containing protein [Roseobacter sp. HKCCD8768]NNV25949.1 multicopper oxidase domain-containing protein [Roseobacter sp. HKCCD8192]NNV30207.1 multicopper oxidase domain-containing protein [Roseobacter sp